MFSLTSTSIDPRQLAQQLVDNRAGAFATFEGWVRNRNEGKDVVALEYEAADVLCQKEAQRILEEARQKFDVLDVACVHRVGKLALGEIAVWVGTTAEHRQDAFAACQYVIDEIKRRLPIWKKETYVDGTSIWVNCQHCHDAGGMPALPEGSAANRSAGACTVDTEGTPALPEDSVGKVHAHPARKAEAK